jgi:serine/threonine protein kinase
LTIEDFENSTDSNSLNIKDFKLCNIPGKTFLGSGLFGKVYLAQRIATKEYFAIKAIRKSFLVENDIIQMTQLESDIMLKNKHPNLIKMVHCF